MSPSHALLDKLCADSLRTLTPRDLSQTHLLLGFSGGRDSHVLLDILVTLRDKGAIPPFSAIHVHHGLHPEADDWANHCLSICQAYRVPLIIEYVTQSPKVGESVEAFAREARYQLIEPHLTANTLFLSAHHQRDQAETFLLQLMRGAGLDGLKAMPSIKPFGQGHYARPLLNVSYADIAHYAISHQLAFIEDDSNADTRFDRNFIRHEILPALQVRFPNASQAIAQSATWLGEVPTVSAPEHLFINQLKQLDSVHQKQQIRQFIKDKTGLSLSKKQTQILADNYLTAAADKHPQLSIGKNDEYLIRRYQGEIIVTKPLPVSLQDDGYWQKQLKKPYFFSFTQPLSFLLSIDINWEYGEGLLLPENTQLELRPLDSNHFFQPHYRYHRQRIKKLFHEQQIPPWLRHLVVGIYWENELLAIPGIGVAKAYYKKNTNAAIPMWQIQTKFVRL